MPFLFTGGALFYSRRQFNTQAKKGNFVAIKNNYGYQKQHP